TGTEAACPADVKSTAICRAAAGDCDVAESCDGVSNDCPADVLEPAGTECRPAAGDCDVPEVCTGASTTCPSDAMKPAGTECRAAAGECDLAESCSGTSPTCPADQKRTDECRPSTGACDAAERCDGASDTCPADALTADGAACDDGNLCTQGDTCQAGQCQGGTPVTCSPTTGCVHRHFEGMAALDCFCGTGIPQASCTNERVPACVPKHFMRACRLITRAHEAKPKKAHRLMLRAQTVFTKGSRLAQRANRRGRISTTCTASITGSFDDAAGRLEEILTAP